MAISGMDPIDDYYRILFDVSGTGGSFQLPIALARIGVFNGDGTEFGPGVISGPRQLRKVLNGLANGLSKVGIGWETVALNAVEIKSTQRLPLSIPADTP